MRVLFSFSITGEWTAFNGGVVKEWEEYFNCRSNYRVYY